jgi:hypothetical protein
MRKLTNYTKYGLVTVPQHELIYAGYPQLDLSSWAAVQKDLVTYGELLDTCILFKQEHWLGVTARNNTLEILILPKACAQAVDNLNQHLHKTTAAGCKATCNDRRNLISFIDLYKLNTTQLLSLILTSYHSKEAERLVLKHSNSNLLLNTERIRKQIENRLGDGFDSLELILSSV